MGEEGEEDNGCSQGLDDEMQNTVSNPRRKIFSGFTFLVSREVPNLPAYLVIKNCGGSVVFLNEIFEKINEESFEKIFSEITHLVVDRPTLASVKLGLNLSFLTNEATTEFFKRFEVVQPQWIFDSFNEGMCLPTAEYGVGQVLPPHLSPFIKDEEQDYIPQRREFLDRLANERKEIGEDVTAEVRKMLTGEADEETYLKEIEMEKNKIPFSCAPKICDADKEADKADRLKRQAERDRQISIMPKKHVKLLQRIEHRGIVKKKIAERLTKKREDLAQEGGESAMEN